MRNHLLTLAAAVIVCWLLVQATMQQITQVMPEQTVKESAYDRVMRTKTFRCGYAYYPSYFEKDPNTGKYSGMYYDIMNEIGKQTGLKIEWVEEVGTATMLEGLKNGRYDGLCIGYFEIPSRAMHSEITIPLMYSAIGVYVRADENRFAGYKDLNNEDVKFAAMDGEFSALLIKDNFPKAQITALPEGRESAERLMMVATKKSDATLIEYEIAAEFMKNNPGQLKPLAVEPLQTSGSSIILPQGDYRLKNLFDSSIRYLLAAGFIDRTINKHMKYPGAILSAVKPYQLPEVK